MKDPAYGFSERETAEKLKAFASRLGGSKAGNTGYSFNTSSWHVMFGEVTTEVTAASGDDLGTGVVKVETWDPNASPVTRSRPDAAQEVTVFNTEEFVIPVAAPVLVYKVSSSYVVFNTSAPTTGYGTLAAALSTGDASATVALDAASPLTSASNITAKNWVGMEGAISAKCIVSYSGGEYILIQVACP